MGRDCGTPGEVFGFEASLIAMSVGNCGMSDPFVQTLEIVTLVGAGPVNMGDLKEVLTRAPFCVGVDGGTEIVRNYGKVPNFVIGDMDSADALSIEGLDPATVLQVDEQESTDFDKALRNIKAPLVLGLGFVGGRIDHQLAVFSTLVRYPQKRCILIGPEDIVFHLPEHLEIELPEGSRFSIFPLRPGRAVSSGLEWPLDGLFLEAGGMLGTSNMVTKGSVRIRAMQPGLLAILPRQALAAASDAFLRSRQIT
jgi:thiamine pyrophosphokinase